jgi:hypothetical protein
MLQQRLTQTDLQDFRYSRRTQHVQQADKTFVQKCKIQFQGGRINQGGRTVCFTKSNRVDAILIVDIASRS